MVAKKGKSKRMSFQRKFKIQKRTKEHRKRVKKGRLSLGPKKTNDNFIPNSWPYKEDMLKEIKSAQERMEEVKLRQREKRSEEIMKKRMGIVSDNMEVDNSVSDKSVAFKEPEEPEHENTINNASLGQNSRRAYLRELRKVVNGADVILHVLDARDPAGTRSSAIEDMVLSNSRKKIVYVLNKADLVPKEILSGWLSYLRKLHPTVPFKCNTQSQSGNLGRVGGKVNKQNENALQTSQAVGAEELISLLKNYCRSGDVKSIISVGIVGFPNVGKSSLINSLLRSRAVGVSSMPGFTKVSQEVILDKNIRLVDCPGVVFADGDSASTALRNCVNVEEMEDVMTPIQAIMDRCPQPYLMQLYTIPKFKAKDAMAFLALVAKNTGRLKKGGIPNIDAAARAVLHDWNSGKIKYYCKPPKVEDSSNDSMKIVSQFSKELDISDLKEEDICVLNAIEAQKEANNAYIAMDEVAERIDIHIGDAEEPSEKFKPVAKKLSKKHLESGSSSVEDDRRSLVSNTTRQSSFNDRSMETIVDETTIGTDIRKLQKKMKKQEAKASRKASKQSGSGEDYSFEDDFKYE